MSTEVDNIFGDASDFDLLILEEPEEEKEDPEPSGPQPTCYCFRERNLNSVELLCANCNKWFHESCITLNLGNIVPFLLNYIFMCKNCTPDGVEIFKKQQAEFQQLCISAIANLQQANHRRGSTQKIFSQDRDIIPYIRSRWSALTTSVRKITQSWHSTVHKTLVQNLHILFVFKNDPVYGYSYGLFYSDLSKIKPNYEQMIKSGILKATDTGVQYVPPVSTTKGKQSKRKLGNETGTSKRSRAHESGSLKLLPHGYPMDHPFNRDGYRYLLAEPDPHAPFCKEFDECSDWAGKPIPAWLYRVVVPRTVLLALHDRAPQLKISEDRLIVTGEKGYSTVRATHWVSHGCWYWEATIVDLPNGAAVRLGWGQEYANLQAPLGYDKYGYSWRSRKGTKFHQSCGKSYSSAYGLGDTLGFLIYIPDTPETTQLPSSYRDRPLVKFKSHSYYEEMDDLTSYDKTCKQVPGSVIVFFKNGEPQGEAFHDILSGNYYPGLSLHKASSVAVNFGPEFKYPPSNQFFQWQAMFKRADDLIMEHLVADLTFLTENEGKLKLDSYVK